MQTYRYKIALLIDDDEIDTLVHASIIKKMALAKHIIIKHSAKEALDFLIHTIPFPEELPEMIFLDINMPLMNGFEFLEQLDKLLSDQLFKSKIIMLSSTIDSVEIEKIKSNPRIDGFICKPLTSQALMQIL